MAVFFHAIRRNTSTDVEKTAHAEKRALRFQKHLHGRGEDVVNSRMTLVFGETPPRTWRRQQDLALG